MIKLPLHLKQMGTTAACGHRSGWPYVMSYLTKLQTKDGFFFDDFVERTFLQTPGTSIPLWQRPWIGVFHHPPNVPEWFESRATWQALTSVKEFRYSLPHLKGAVTLSKYLGNFIREQLGVPTLNVLHPTEVPMLQWSPNRFANNGPKLVQIGWWLRNLAGIYQVETPINWSKWHLHQNQPWVNAAYQKVRRYSPYKDRPDVGVTNVQLRITNEEYDKLLASCVVFAEFFDTSANNAVIECIVRGTPLVTNRHPATEEYLGVDYPMFFDDYREIPKLLKPENIWRTNEYLCTLDKTTLSGEYFRDVIALFVEKIRSSI